MCSHLNTCTTGDGKTHYIESQLHYSPHPLRITVNESFMPLNVIKRLSSLPFDVHNCAVFFNMSLLPPGVSELHLNLHMCTHDCCYVNITGICWWGWTATLWATLGDNWLVLLWLVHPGLCWGPCNWSLLSIPRRHGLGHICGGMCSKVLW